MTITPSDFQFFSPKFIFLSLTFFALAFSGCSKIKEGYKKGAEQAQRDAGKAEPTPVPTPITLTAEDLKNNQSVDLDKLNWKYQAGDDIRWAEPDLDDSAWENVTPKDITGLTLPKTGWNGIGWFRLPVIIDETLVGLPLGLEINHPGASEIYVDGKLARSYGKVAANTTEEKTYNPDSVPFGVTFAQAGKHTLIVRYSNADSGSYPLELSAFQLEASALNPTINELIDKTALQNGIKGGIFGICLALGLLHLLLFVLYPQQKGNLYYSLFLLAEVTSVVLIEVFLSHMGAGLAITKMLVGTTTGGIYYLAFTAYLYTVLENRIPRQLKVMLILWAIVVCLFLIAFLAVNNILTYIAFGVSMLIFLVLIIWHITLISIIIIRAISRKVDNSLVLGIIGLSFIASAITSSVLASVYGENSIYLSIGEFSCMTLLIVANAVFLASQFARTSKNLEQQLVKEVDYEKERARLTIVEAENERRAQELEEARQSQLSMLPKKLPVIPNLEIAAYMKPATEVGGDYYDFHVGKDGTLTVAVGDATGHGLKAGTVVTATKSLFNNLASAPDIPDTLQQISRSLKAMNLRGLFMAMTMIKLKDNSLNICAAGMPSTLVYRADKKMVEEINIRALPLGGMTNFKYRGQEISLETGDVVIVMSDGFPEMFNPENEMLGFDKAAEVLKEIAMSSPQEIIDRFVEVSRNWSDTRPADDDVTFVVLKML